jgi:hypothetical protein
MTLARPRVESLECRTLLSSAWKGGDVITASNAADGVPQLLRIDPTTGASQVIFQAPTPQVPAGDDFQAIYPGINSIGAEPNGDIVFSMRVEYITYPSGGNPFDDADGSVSSAGIYVLHPGQSAAQQIAPQSGPLAVVPIANYVWTGAGPDNLWSDASNWLGGSAPTPGAYLQFPSGAQQLSNQNDLGYVFGSVNIADNYTISTGGIDVLGVLTVGSGASLDIPSGTVTVEAGGGGLDVQGTLTVESGGQVDDLGAATIETGGVLNDLGAVKVELGASLYSYGTVTVGVGASLYSVGTVSVDALDDYGSVTTLGNFFDNGRVTVASGASLLATGGGSLDVNAGDLLDDGGTVTVDSAAGVLDAGTVTVENGAALDLKFHTSLVVAYGAGMDDSGAVTVESTALLSDWGVVTVESGGEMVIDGELEIQSTGSLHGQGYVIVSLTGVLSDQDAITVAPTGTLDVSGSLVEGSGGKLDVLGDVTTEAGGTLDDFSTVTIEIGGALDIYGTVTIEAGASYNPLGTVIVEPGGQLKVIQSAATGTAVVSSSSSPAWGDSVTFTATVTPPSGSSGTPTGTVAFLDGNTSLGTGTLQLVNGVDQATFSTSSLDVGDHTITAVYGGDSTFQGSISGAVSVTVSQAAPVLTWPDPSAIVYGTILGPAQLDASASVAGSFLYNPGPGTVLPPGTGESLSVQFTPADATHYTTATLSVPITVLYNFSGFEIPYLAALKPGTRFGLGTTVNLEFQLHDAAGNLLSGVPAGTSLQAALVHADGSLGAPFTPASLLNKGLFWDSTNDHFNWVTKGLAAGTYELILTLADGTVNTTTVQLVSQQGGAKAEMAQGSDAGLDSASGLNGLLLGDLYVYVDDPTGYFSADELARIQDAITSVDQVLAPYHVQIAEVSDPSTANLVLDSGTTSASGTAADGVLGCFDVAHMEITLLQGWDWYAGADPGQIGAGQYDFQTTVTHELGHALGLGHNPDLASPMNGTLPTGTVRRTLLLADLNIPQEDAGPDALHASPPAALARNASPSFLAGASLALQGERPTLAGSAWNGSVGAASHAALGSGFPDALGGLTRGGTTAIDSAVASDRNGLGTPRASAAEEGLGHAFGQELDLGQRAPNPGNREAGSRTPASLAQPGAEEETPLRARVGFATDSWGLAGSSVPESMPPARQRAFVEWAAPRGMEDVTDGLTAGRLAFALALTLPASATLAPDRKSEPRRLVRC